MVQVFEVFLVQLAGTAWLTCFEMDHAEQALVTGCMRKQV
jgi:hypothetical protein